MKTKVVFLLVLAGCLPITVPAQTPPPQPGFSAMRSMMEQARTLRKNERTQVLNALSSAHRVYLASIVGQLAVATNPDPKTAAAQLDARLSSDEKAVILNADRSFRDQMRALHDKMGLQMRTPGFGRQGRDGPMLGPGPVIPSGQHVYFGHRTPDAGSILLEVTRIEQ